MYDMRYETRLRRRRRLLPKRITVNEFQAAVLLRNGAVTGALPTGRHWLLPSDELRVESAVPQVLLVPNQEVLTADGIAIKASIASTVTVSDPLAALRAGDWRARFHLHMQLALRELVTAESLEELIANRASLDDPLLEAAAAASAELGLTVHRVALRDLIVPGEQKRLLSDVVAAKLAGQAALERARAETAALRNLANAANLLKETPELYRLRLLQEMAASTGNTYVIDTEPPRTTG